MIGNGWGWPTDGSAAKTSGDTAERVERRAQERAERAQERANAAAERAQTRAAQREDAARQREANRELRPPAGLQPRATARDRAAGDRDAAATSPARRSGRKDVVREQRDTRAYRTVVDVERMRALAARGASVTGLAGAFGVSIEEVEQLLSAAAADV